jgi:hypothetical protein
MWLITVVEGRRNKYFPLNQEWWLDEQSHHWGHKLGGVCWVQPWYSCQALYDVEESQVTKCSFSYTAYSHKTSRVLYTYSLLLVSTVSSFSSCNGSLLLYQIVLAYSCPIVDVKYLFIQSPMANLATISKIPHASSCLTYGHSGCALAKWLTSSLISVVLCPDTQGGCQNLQAWRHERKAKQSAMMIT